MNEKSVAAAGAGRMGRGIAVAFAMAGHHVHLIDLKDRTKNEFLGIQNAALEEIRSTLLTLAEIGLYSAERIEPMLDQVSVYARGSCGEALSSSAVVFEAVPETVDAKSEAFELICEHANDHAIIASTTSTILSDDLAPMVRYPRRFLNAHWLNPAFLVPLIELSPAEETGCETVDEMKALLESIGKIPVVCKASPGYIVPRIQMLAMNEAARMVEEGVASVEDIDKATKYGFGFRFAILGMLEFIDWGGGDILYHAGKYMTDATGEQRFDSPDIIKQNMDAGRVGLRSGSGFLDYSSMNVADYRRQRLSAFVGMLKHLDLMPNTG